MYYWSGGGAAARPRDENPRSRGAGARWAGLSSVRASRSKRAPRGSKIIKQPYTRRKNPKRKIPAFVARFHSSKMSLQPAALAMFAKEIFKNSFHHTPKNVDEIDGISWFSVKVLK